MIEILSETMPTARTSHDCYASTFIRERGVNGYGYSFAELRTIAKAKKNNWQIVKGQKYIRQNNKADGKIYCFKAIPEMHQICIDHDHYDC